MKALTTSSPRSSLEDDVYIYDPADRSKLDGIFGPYGDKSWTGFNIYDRVAAIEHLCRLMRVASSSKPFTGSPIATATSSCTARRKRSVSSSIGPAMQVVGIEPAAEREPDVTPHDLRRLLIWSR